MAFTAAPLAPTFSRHHPRRAVSRRRPARAAAPRMTLAPAPPPPVHTEEPVILLNGVAEYLDALELHRDRLVVLKIFAPWCRSCRALAPKVNRLAREFSDVRFFKIDYEQHKDLCYRIGVTAMPTFVFYHGKAGEIDKFSCGPQRAGILRSKIEDCLRGQCALEDHE